MIKEAGFWIDENNNRWSCGKYTESHAIEGSKSLINCRNCVDCFNCNSCCSCYSCAFCKFCDSCYCCDSCNYCNFCYCCGSCNYCKSYQVNPQRITSYPLGRENRQTTIYWVGRDIQVHTGCFHGSLKEFKAEIEKTHGDNGYAKAYHIWLYAAEKYINSVTEKEVD